MKTALLIALLAATLSGCTVYPVITGPYNTYGQIVLVNRDVRDLRVRIIPLNEERALAPGLDAHFQVPRGLYKVEVIAQVEPGYWKRQLDFPVEVTTVDQVFVFHVSAGNYRRVQ